VTEGKRQKDLGGGNAVRLGKAKKVAMLDTYWGQGGNLKSSCRTPKSTKYDTLITLPAREKKVSNTVNEKRPLYIVLIRKGIGEPLSSPKGDEREGGYAWRTLRT